MSDPGHEKQLQQLLQQFGEAMDLAPQFGAILGREGPHPAVAVMALMICARGITDSFQGMPPMVSWAKVTSQILDETPGWKLSVEKAGKETPQ